MFKTGLPLFYAELLVCELKKQLNCCFMITESGLDLEISPIDELTKQGEEQVKTIISAFIAGVKAVDTKLDSVQMHLTKAINEINQL